MLPDLDWRVSTVSGCLQKGREGFEHGGEVYLLNSMLQKAEKGLVDYVNLFAELTSIWQQYTSTVSMFLSIQYGNILILLGTNLLKYEVSEFVGTLLSIVFVNLYGVAERKHFLRIYEPRSIEMELMIKNANIIHGGVSAPSKYVHDSMKNIVVGGFCRKTCFLHVLQETWSGSLMYKLLISYLYINALI